jgi:N-methylhydantoinase A/oxoprolinase/acetone carboxylase beta subunit
MDSVKALVEKLSEQLRQNEDKTRLIITVQQILTELGGAVLAKPLPQNIYQETTMVAPAEEVVIQTQISPELAPVSNTVQELETPVEVIDENLVANIVEAPVVEISQASLEVVKTESNLDTSEKIEIKEVKDHLVMEPIKDLRSAIGINDKFQFIQELFGGDEKSFEVGIKTINAFKIFPEAQFYIKRELREKNNWDEESNVVKQFDQLIKRRFS